MQRSHKITLLVVKLILVGLLIVWLYSRSEPAMNGERDEVRSGRGMITATAPGGPASVELEQRRAVEFYNLVRDGSWALKGNEARGTIDIIYSTGASDHIEITG